MVGVKQAQRFGHAFLQIAAVLLEGLGAADIDLPQVEGRLAVGHPLRQRHARPARGRDADGIIARRDPIAFQLRRLAQIIAVIGGEAFGTVEEGMDPRLRQQRHAGDGLFQDRFEMVEILGQLVKAEILGDARHAPGLGPGFERTQQDLARVLLVIGAFVGDAQHGKPGKFGNGFGNDIEMLAGVQRQGDIVPGGQIAAPHAAAVHHVFAGNMAAFAAACPVDTGHAAVGGGDARDPDLLDDAGPAHPCALGQRQRDIARIGLPIQRQVDARHHVRNLQMGVKRQHFAWGKLIHVHAEGAGQGRLAQDLLAPLPGQRDGDRAALPQAGRQPGFRLKPGVKIGGIFRQPRHVLAGAQLTDQPRRMPGGARGQLLALEQQDVGPAELRQVIGDGTAGNAASDNDDAGLGGQFGHGG